MQEIVAKAIICPEGFFIPNGVVSFIGYFTIAYLLSFAIGFFWRSGK